MPFWKNAIRSGPSLRYYWPENIPAGGSDTYNR